MGERVNRKVGRYRSTSFQKRVPEKRRGKTTLAP